MSGENQFKKPTLSKEIMINHIVGELLNNKAVKYRVGIHSPTEGLKIPVFIQGNNAKIIEEYDFMELLKTRATRVFESVREDYKKADLLLLTYSTAREVMKTILVHKDMQLKTAIKTFAFKSDPAVTFCRIPFDLSDVEIPCESWDKFLDNFTNITALKIWVGSLFIPNSDRSQYLWLYGKGGNGKSTLARVLASILGNFVRFDQAPAAKHEDKYWTFGLLGKRLVVIDDCNNYGFVKTGLFKSCTGMGRVRVEQKFGHPHDADLDCKFLFTSNEKPMVSSEIADQRRLIFCAAKNQESFDFNANFLEELKKDLPNFISNCVRLYSEHCIDGRPIPTDQTEALELGQVFHEEIEAWVEQHFEFQSDAYVTVAKFREELSRTKLNDRKVYTYLEEKGIERVTKKIDGKVIKVIKGIRRTVVTLQHPIY